MLFILLCGRQIEFNTDLITSHQERREKKNGESGERGEGGDIKNALNFLCQSSASD